VRIPVARDLGKSGRPMKFSDTFARKMIFLSGKDLSSNKNAYREGVY
jgi:hypothetical protein